MSVNPDRPRTVVPRPPAPNRRFARAMRTTATAGQRLDYPSSLLRYPMAAMFLLMREAFRLGQQRMAEAQTPAEQMRFSHFAVLACLDEFGSASQREVSERLQLDPSDLVAVVDWLEEAGFVRRRRDERDRRRYALDLTAAGRRALRVRARSAERMNEDLFSALDPQERADLRTLILKALSTNSAR
jgi:MarR family transcriptional regulator, lower aerobic nicotinate degradation pathway regulator